MLRLLRPTLCYAVWLGLLGGCAQWYMNDADRQVGRLIEKRQRAALGLTADADVLSRDAQPGPDDSIYSRVPSPIDPEVPAAFRLATTIDAGDAPLASDASTDRDPSANDAEPGSPDPTADDQPEPNEPNAALDGTSPNAAAQPQPEPFTLSDALSYAIAHSRRYKTEREILFLAALDLTLERDLWTPRFINSVLQLDYTNAGQTADFDQSLEIVSDFAVQQRLPYGGEITARVINTLIRSLTDDVTTGESGQVILDARLPLVRGAGRVAYETRYQAERDLIYAIRAFEDFRRNFLVDIAGDYFRLLESKSRIESAESQAASLKEDYARDKLSREHDLIIQVEADRTRVTLLNAQNAAVIAREEYATALDFFKVRIGMPPDRPIDVVEEDLDLYEPRVGVDQAVQAALKYRLDLATLRDRVGDARRGILIARNNLLPQVDLTGTATVDTNPSHLRSTDFNASRTSFRAGLSVELPMERTAERNAYAAAQIRLQQADRALDLQQDTVRLEVQRAIRRIARARSSLDIQQQNVEVNALRAQIARTEYRLGTLSSNRDVVEAENDLRNAKNNHAAALAGYRRAILEFLRDTGTLRVNEHGQWVVYEPEPDQSISSVIDDGAAPQAQGGR